MSVAQFTSYAAQLLCNLLGNFYPAYASYKAVLSRDPEEHKQWLCYWVVNALFIVFELIGDTFISWLPLYYEAKLGFICWLTFQRGATVIYDNLVHKYLERFEPEIDAQLSALQQSADAAFEGLKSRAVRHLQRGSRSILQAGGAALAELAMATATTAALEAQQQEGAGDDDDDDGGGGAGAAGAPRTAAGRRRRGDVN